MSLASNIQSAFVRVATEFKAIRTLISGSGTGTISGLTTTDKSSLVAAINEAAASGGGASALDGLSDVTITAPADGHLLRNNGAGQFVNVLGTTHFQPRDSDLDAIAALATTAFGQNLLTLADAAAFTNSVSAASETISGRVELATQAETSTGTDDIRAVTPLKVQTRLAAYAQPLDSDLTAIAALTTTAYGRAFLALADQAALMTLIASASETVQGKVELASNAEAVTGTDTARATTPANVAAVFTDRIDTNVALGASNVKVPSQAAVKAYADGIIAAADAMVFKGVIDASANPNYPASNRGDTYRISVAGKIGGAAGPNVEVGDLLLALTDGTAAGNHATVGAQWNITQANVDGAVVGPVSSVSGNLTSFSGTGGKVVQDSGLSTDNDTSLAANSATRLPTQAAVKAYADTKQTSDADLTAIAALVSAADRVPYATGAGAWSLATFTATGRSVVGAADAAAVRTAISTYSQAEIGDPATDFVTAFTTALA